MGLKAMAPKMIVVHRRKNPEINSGDGGQNENEINDGGILQGNPNVGGQEKEDSDKKPGPPSVKRQIFKA